MRKNACKAAATLASALAIGLSGGFCQTVAMADTGAVGVVGVMPDGSGFTLANDGLYGSFQGACTDGKYVYAVLENRKAPTGVPGEYQSDGIIRKIDIGTWEVVGQSGILPLGHGNDIAYNPKTGLLMVPNNSNGAWNHVTLVDAGTLDLVGGVDLECNIYSLAYNEARDCYVAGIGGSYDFAILDSGLHMAKRVPGIDTGHTRQGIDCDDEHVCFIQSGASDATNSVICYDWDGGYVGAYGITDCQDEAENLFHAGGAFYAGFNTGGGKGGTIWKLSPEP